MTNPKTIPIIIKAILVKRKILKQIIFFIVLNPVEYKFLISFASLFKLSTLSRFNNISFSLLFSNNYLF